MVWFCTLLIIANGCYYHIMCRHVRNTNGLRRSTENLPCKIDLILCYDK